jgi:prophage regulatory protein
VAAYGDRSTSTYRGYDVPATMRARTLRLQSGEPKAGHPRHESAHIHQILGLTWSALRVTIDHSSQQFGTATSARLVPRETPVASTSSAPKRFMQVLRLPQVRQVTGLGRSMIYLLESQRRFPRRIKIGARAVGWLQDEVQAWVAARVERSRGRSGG